jgi:pyruvate/2-oxoglutarate/acetoin dehydrogenase E1 component
MKIQNLIIYITKTVKKTKRIIIKNKTNSIIKFAKKISKKIIKFIRIILKIVMQIIIIFNIIKIYNKKFKLFKTIKIMALISNKFKKI